MPSNLQETIQSLQEEVSQLEEQKSRLQQQIFEQKLAFELKSREIQSEARNQAELEPINEFNLELPIQDLGQVPINDTLILETLQEMYKQDSP
jgi:hypothetical protein